MDENVLSDAVGVVRITVADDAWVVDVEVCSMGWGKRRLALTGM